MSCMTATWNMLPFSASLILDLITLRQISGSAILFAVYLTVQILNTAAPPFLCEIRTSKESQAPVHYEKTGELKKSSQRMDNSSAGPARERIFHLTKSTIEYVHRFNQVCNGV